MEVVYVSYDKTDKDMSAISCCVKKDDGTIEMKVCYVGEKADILHKLVTEQGYLDTIKI